MATAVESRAPAAGRTRLLLIAGGLVVLAALGASLAWMLAADESQSAPGAPARVSTDDLRELAGSAGHPVYWAGRASGDSYELTETRRGAFHVRYLPAGTAAGDERPAFLTVSTYPYRRAYAVTSASAEGAAMSSTPAPGGGLAVWSNRRPTNVYVAYPGTDLLVEVYSPRARQARGLVTAGDVGPIR